MSDPTDDDGNGEAQEHSAGDGQRRVPEAVAAALRERPVEEVLAMVLMRQRHLEEAVKRLRGLVPEAFKEGFAMRNPDTVEPWLADWVTSDTKATLEGLFER